MSKPIAFAIVGCGHIGKRHAEMVRRNPNATLLGLCDIRDQTETGLTEIKEPYFASLKEMLEECTEVEVVCICTPNGLHAEQAIECIEAGKHVVIEKPMGLTKSACEEVIFKALKASKQVFCVMQNRYSPPSVWIKECIDKGLLGEIYMAQINCYWNRDDRYYTPGHWHGTQDLDGGTLFTQFSHFVDIMYWLLGDIDEIQGQISDFAHQDTTDFEDSGFLSFRFKNGALGTLNFSTAVWDKNFESSMTLIGSKGTVKIGGQYMNEVEYCHIEGYDMPVLPPSNPANDYGAYKGSANNHSYVIQNVIDVLNGKTSISTTALEGMKVVEIIERMYALKKTKIYS